MSDTTVHIVPDKLSDGSMVYNVVIPVCGRSLLFAAVTEHDAHVLAETIVNAIEEHTVNAARVVVESH